MNSAFSASEIVLYVGYGLIVLIWYLLRQKDSQQQEAIALLFKKHDDDAQALQDLKIQLAKMHYEKPEVDVKFEKLEKTVADGFADLGKKFDRLSDALMSHMQDEAKSGGKNGD